MSTPPRPSLPDGHAGGTAEDLSAGPAGTSGAPRRPGELTPRELLRWLWRQLTSMRTALVLLLLLALAAVPGSVVPQEGVDSLKTSNWKEEHPDLTPIYERLGLFDVYDSPWFAAIYLLLFVSLVGCIIPRLGVYWRALRAQPPAAPRNLTRLPDSTAYRTDASADEVLARAREVLRGRRYRLRRTDPAGPGADAVSAERGHLREAGNLVFHLSLLVVLVGFAMGGLLGYRGGVIVIVGDSFSNGLTSYDDFAPGDLFDETDMEPFCFTVEDFSAEWVMSGPGQGTARGFRAPISYREDCAGTDASEAKSYDLRVNHPLSIGDTDVFLIGHGYAPVVTIRDGEGNVAAGGPRVFLPQSQDFFSFGVIKAPDAKPGQIALEGLFYPTFANIDGDPVNIMGDDKNPLLSMSVYTGDIGLDNGSAQSVYALDKTGTEQVMKADGKPFRLDIAPGQTVRLPDGLGSVTFERVVPWTRLQISQTPGMKLALGGVVLALVGLLGSLFIRPRRVWVRARADGAGTLVEVAGLDRSGGGDVAAELAEVVAALRGTDDTTARGGSGPSRAADPDAAQATPEATGTNEEDA
ncbi:cytochrome c biogenesis protein ResB [Nocardioides ferulae]|uniref:cytochrome c biogenesis protein ResB n=1 Tax=Nocardioides ferulae TaxID=2340821 RepID=UPI001F0BEBD1|nr:cytochrome c biogenesis protein ResB [Nocardioides ferulae]